MTEGLSEEDVSQVLFVRELVEHRSRGAPHGEAEIDGIAEVDSQCQAVDNQEDGTAQLLIGGCFLVMQWKQHQHDIRDVGYQDGTGVEDQTTSQHLQDMGERQVLREITVVLQKIDKTRQEIDHIDYQQIVERDTQWGQQRLQCRKINFHVTKVRKIY